MKILVIGGTQFLGRHIVAECLEQGINVTLLNRGLSSPDLFPKLPRLIGDRNDTEHLHKASLSDNWDAVIDCCGYFPGSVEKSACAFQASHYIFISSVSVYDDFNCEAITETSPTCSTSDAASLNHNTAETYGMRKKACEDVVQKIFQKQATVIRPGLIVGPNDPTWRFPYWVDRIGKGGKVLAPGHPKDQVQFIDVRDLAKWILEVASRQILGTYNAVGPYEPLTWGQLLDGIQHTLDNPCKITWVEESALLAKSITPWTDLPLWVPQTSRGIHRVDGSKARQRGLTSRAITDTIQATWQSIRSQDILKSEDFGLTLEKEKSLLSTLA
ncbi:MAG: NAD-dependent epimerase/dehydratase family protein [Pseudobacteriovorax sp.]|nr:NAD-dependent epimerase/dehydratase family protein [Pseudobacteriovorax sp.]